MRISYQETNVIVHENTFIGIDLGWDFCAEHERGIRRLKQDFGVPGKPNRKCLGFDSRKIAKVPDGTNWSCELVYLEKGKHSYLGYFRQYGRYDNQDEKKAQDLKFLDRMLGNIQKDNIKCAWDEKTFGIKVDTKKRREQLKELYDAFQKKDVVVFLGGSGNPFSNAGLKIFIHSRIPNEALQMAEDTDRATLDLDNVVDKTGIVQKLKDADRKYYALRPSYRSDKDKKQSKHQVHFFLNPADQHIYNYGWFTVEELEQWIDGRGPVRKKKS